MIYQAEAIVLQGKNYSESSRILTVYTNTFGKLTVIAKGARRIKNRFGAGLDLFSHSEIVFYLKENRHIQTITQCTPRHVFDAHQSMIRLSYASALAELVDRLITVPEIEPAEIHQHIFDLLRAGLELVETTDEKNLPPLLWAFILKFAEILGYRPQLKQCAKCKEPITEPKCAFAAAEGSIYHIECLTPRQKEGAVFISLGSLKSLQRLQDGQLNQASRLKLHPPIQIECKQVLKKFIIYHLPQIQSLKSLIFLEKISN